MAHEHMPHVVKPSAWAASSRKGGLGGGGTKFPLNKPLSVASNARGDPKPLSLAPIHQLSSLRKINESSGDGDMFIHQLCPGWLMAALYRSGDLQMKCWSDGVVFLAHQKSLTLCPPTRTDI